MFVVCVLNQRSGNLARFLLEPEWIVTTGDHSSAGGTGESDCPEWGLLSHQRLRTSPWNQKQTHFRNEEQKQRNHSKDQSLKFPRTWVASEQWEERGPGRGADAPRICWLHSWCWALCWLFSSCVWCIVQICSLYSPPNRVLSSQSSSLARRQVCLVKQVGPEPLKFEVLSLFLAVLTSEGMHSASWGLLQENVNGNGRLVRMSDHPFIQLTNIVLIPLIFSYNL